MVCSIPVFTLGASVVALYTVTLKLSEHEEGHIVRDFFKAFRDNFRQATAIWGIMFVIGVVLGVDLYVVRGSQETPVVILNTLFYIFGFVYLMIFSYVFPLQSKFENKVKDTFKNALTVGIGNLLPWTVLLMGMNMIPVALLFLPLQLFLYLLPLIVGFLFGTIAFINSKMLNCVFQKYIEKIEGLKVNEKSVHGL